MLGNKKKPQVSASRFCRQAIELPYTSLFRADEFTLAVTRLSTYHDFPVQRRFRPGVDQPLAFGVVHQEGSTKADGSVEPLLPVEITFEPEAAREPLGHGHFNRAGMETDATYFLQVSISDPDGVIHAAFDKALFRAIASGINFMHLRCVRYLDHGYQARQEKKPDWRKDREEDRAFLKAVDRGEAELPPFTFEKLSFNNDLTTKAPAWSWMWRDLEFERPGLEDAATAKWRRSWLPHR